MQNGSRNIAEVVHYWMCTEFLASFIPRHFAGAADVPQDSFMYTLAQVHAPFMYLLYKQHVVRYKGLYDLCQDSILGGWVINTTLQR